MKIGDTIRRTDIMGTATQHTIHDIRWLEQHKAAHKSGYEYEVLKDGEWEVVPRIVIHQKAIPDACVSCEG